ncbi:MAG: DUF4867 family protein [bacterium]
MKLYSIYDPAFKPYGKVLEGYDVTRLLSAMREIPLPAEGVAYKPSIPSLEDCGLLPAFRDRAYGGMPIQIGMCWGRNTKLNCLEYHRDSELNIGILPYVLLLAKVEDILDGQLSSNKVVAFHAPAGAVVEVYATTLHYAPCHLDAEEGFHVAVVLPRGTNEEMPAVTPENGEDKLLWARNKWLIAHPDSQEARLGAHVGIIGANPDITK